MHGDSGKFKATIRTTFRNEEDIAMFIQNYGLKNNETLRIKKRRKATKKGEYILLKYYRCHHNTRYEPTMCPPEILVSKPAKRFKNTNCPFSRVVRLGKDVDAEYNSIIEIEWNHNHSFVNVRVWVSVFVWAINWPGILKLLQQKCSYL